VKIKTFLGNIVMFAVFTASAVFLGTIFGFAIHMYQFFPYRLLKEAQLGIEALMEVDRGRPASFLEFATGVQTGPQAIQLSGNHPTRDDWILVTGGPYEFMEQCPQYGCLAWIVDRSGAVVHSWETDLDLLWREYRNAEGFTGPLHNKWLGTHLLDDGSLLVAFWNSRAFPNGGGLGKFDIDGNLVWFNDLNIHHWFTVDDDGTIYAPAHEVKETPIEIGNTRNRLECEEFRAEVDYVAIINADGNLVKRINLADLLVDNGFIGLIQLTTSQCDPFHLNFVQYIDADVARLLEGVERGDLLISMRNTNTIMIFSPETGIIKMVESNRVVRQHSPRFLPDGSIVVFDNKGGDKQFGGSRVTRHRLGEDELTVVVPSSEFELEQDFYTNYGGHISVSNEGERLMISLTKKGEILEVEIPTGRVTWRYQKVFPADSYPGIDPEDQDFIRVEAFGAYYVDKAKLAPVFGSAHDRERADRTLSSLPIETPYR
jgi:hypothetical protein